MEVDRQGTTSNDLYNGYDEFKPSYDFKFGKYGTQNLSSSHERMSTSFMLSSSSGNKSDATSRPLTAIRPVGYSSHGSRRGAFDPLQSSGNISSKHIGVEDRNDLSDEKINLLEKKVNELIEESCVALMNKDVNLALEKAKQADQKEKLLSRQREQLGLGDQPNLDLLFTVLLNLASQYAANEMYSESLNIYQTIMRNRMFQNAGRLKVNMGNIYAKLGNYAKAIKMYRMALDQVPNTQKRLRIKIMENIGILFVKMGKYSDAITSFEYIMGEYPDFKTGLNLILCFYALGDQEKMKSSFKKLVDIRVAVESDDKIVLTMSNPHFELLSEAIKGDTLHVVEQSKKLEAEWCILMAAKLISPIVDKTISAGFAWCVDIIKGSPYGDLAWELEINKAITFLKQKEFSLAIETLEIFEKKKDSKVASTVATNLSFLYILKNDISQAEKYANMAINADHYNSGGLVNKGCCAFIQNNFGKAQACFREALVNDITCIEALFNLGLCLSHAGHYADAFNCFKKLHSVVPNQPTVIYNIARTCELLQDNNQAIEWYQLLLSVIQTEPGTLHQMGQLLEMQGEKQHAFQFYLDSYRYFPSKIEIIAWLGTYYVTAEVYEKALKYFERAVLLKPKEVKWYLMIASCYRRSGNYQRALHWYKLTHNKFPNNVECLRFLVRLSVDMGIPDANKYTALLEKAESYMDSKEKKLSGVSNKQELPSFNLNENGHFKNPLELSRVVAEEKTTFDEGFAHEELGDDFLP